jgi:4-diphosphocytidyl-2-C-methyl-D-erythritol kinase
MKVVAPAKATLLLRVLGLRADGYHDLEALVVSLSEPYDDIETESIPGDRVELTVEGDSIVPTDETNLAWRAADALGGGVRLRLVKRIPSRAGLGGGSSDAAAVLRALDPSGEWAEGVAAGLGSDVPYCLRGGLARMRGRGEIVEPLPGGLAGLGVLVVVPPFRLSTPDVYRAWDELGGPRAVREIDAPAAVRPYASVLVNDLEPAAEAIEPRLRPWRDELESVVGAPAVMAGSGTAHLVLTDGAVDHLKTQVMEHFPDTEVWAATAVR